MTEALSIIGRAPPAIKIAVAAFAAMRIIVCAAAAGRAVRSTHIMDPVSASVPGVSAQEKIYDFLVVAFVR